MNAAQLSAQLRDIQGLGSISPWPPATGWWLVLLAVVRAFMLLSALWHWLKWRRRMPRGSWQRDAARQLHSLRKRIDRGDAKQISAELSELVRRIAIARCGRAACAGLSGKDWLTWLAQHDPHGFDWEQRGQPMLDLLYAPPGGEVRTTDLHQILNAALAWATQQADCTAANEVDHGD